jgi:hypothetical protein
MTRRNPATSERTSADCKAAYQIADDATSHPKLVAHLRRRSHGMRHAISSTIHALARIAADVFDPCMAKLDR